MLTEVKIDYVDIVRNAGLQASERALRKVHENILQDDSRSAINLVWKAFERVLKESFSKG